MASTRSSISEVLTDLNMTDNPSSRSTNTTAPEIAVAGQEPIAIGLLASALDRRPSRGRQNVSRPGGTHLVRQEINARNGSARLRRRGLSFAFPFAVGTLPQPEPEIGDGAG